MVVSGPVNGMDGIRFKDRSSCQVFQPGGFTGSIQAYGPDTFRLLQSFRQHARGLPGDSRGGVDHPHVRAGDLLDQRDDEREVRTAHHNGINALFEHG